MKKLFVAACVCVCLFSCKNERKIPDVSGIKTPVKVLRFDQAFFALDTNNIEGSLNNLQTKYGSFLNDYLYNILAVPPMPDSVPKYIKMFLHDYTSLYTITSKKFPDFKQAQDIEKGLQFTKYYFPKYQPPQQVITFVGPPEGYGNVLTSSGFAVGLQMYLGRDFEGYHTDYVSEVYPVYQSRRFEAGYIPVNCMTNIINEIYPKKSGSQTLIEQMVEEGKRMYVLDQLLPITADTLKTGYTAAQLQGCYDNEDGIWNYFNSNNLLYIIDPLQTRDYVNDAPRTEALGEASPGNIGLFVGWQIVKKWMDMQKEMPLEKMLQTPPKQIFQEAKYKPH